MKVLCLSEDRDWGKRIREEAARLRWNAILVGDRHSLPEAVAKHDPDLVLIGIGGRAVVLLGRDTDLETMIVAMGGLDALLHRGTADRRHVRELGLTIDDGNFSISVHGKLIVLTLKEFKILRELAQPGAEAVGRLQILARVFHEASGNRVLDVHICALRKKLKPNGLEIECIRGVGYRLKPCRP